MSQLPRWPLRPLSEVVSLQRGFDLPHHARRPGPFPVLTSGETGGWHDEGPVRGPGVVIGRATNLGRPKWSSGDFWPHNTTLFVSDFKGHCERWVFHLFEHVELSGYDSGSVQPMLNRNYIAGTQVPVPPRQHQFAIAEVLGALDDKLANNAELADTAMALADAHFDAVVGQTADGRSFEEAAEIGGGGTPSTAEPTLWAGEIPWATPTDVTALRAPYLWSTSRTISGEGLSACASPLYPAGSILMTSRATIGAFAIAERPMAVNQGFIVVNSRQPGRQWWLFHQMRARVQEFLSYANGATFLELSRGRFRQLPVWTAEDAVLAEFDHLAEVLHGRASAAMRENDQLAILRDALLPELMSGRLRVKDAERAVEEVV